MCLSGLAYMKILHCLCHPSMLRLRALSGGGSNSNSIASPPLSPAMPKYKLADYRYGREEMLALYVKDNKVSGSILLCIVNDR